MALSNRLQQLNRIIELIKQDQLPMNISGVYAFGPFAAGDEDAPLDLLLVPGIPTESFTPAAAMQRVQETRATLVALHANVQVTLADDALAYFHAHDVQSYLHVWSDGHFRLWGEETSFGFPHADKRLFDFVGLVDPNCFEFNAKTYALCRQFVSDGTLSVETPGERPTWTFSPRQAALLAQPKLMAGLTDDRECLEAALAWMSCTASEEEEEDAYWFRPGVIDFSDGSIRVRYGLVPLKEILHDFASNPNLEQIVAVSPTAEGPRRFHVFTADEGMRSGGVQVFHDRLQILETHERFGEVL